jgi:hypothetical protein
MADPYDRLQVEWDKLRADRDRLERELAAMTSDRDMWQELTAQMGDGWTEVREVIGVRPGETYLPAAQRLRGDRDRLSAENGRLLNLMCVAWSYCAKDLREHCPGVAQSFEQIIAACSAPPAPKEHHAQELDGWIMFGGREPR